MKDAPYDLLKTLIAVAESKNFREAADRLGISQPAVTFKLKELEAGQPLPLFTYEGKKKVLTRYGRSLYEAAKEAAVEFERKIEGVSRIYEKPERLTVRIGGRIEVLKYLAPFLDFNGRIDFVDLATRDAVNSLLEHRVDVAISYTQPDSAEIHAKKLFQSTALFSVHESHLKRCKLDRDLIKDRHFLRETPCIFYTEEGHLVDDWATHLGLEARDLNVKYVVEDWGTVQDLVEQGVGYSIVPSYIRNRSSETKRLEMPANVLEPLDFYALYESSLRKIPAFKSLLAFSRKMA